MTEPLAPRLSVVPYKGTRDFYPEDMQIRNHIFACMRSAAESFGYQEYDGPMLELFELYAAKSGEELVNEQLYHFRDRAERHVAIRPEMTPTVARMVAARINELPRPIRWFSFPNLWRYEKPQRGRLREHWQFNVDVFGVDSIAADQEIIEIAIGVMLRLGAGMEDFSIHVSNRKLLNSFLLDRIGIDDEHRKKVCRAIDKKAKLSVEAFHEMVTDAGLSPGQIDELEAFMNLNWADLDRHSLSDSQGASEIRELFRGLESAGLAGYCRLDPSIVRGLDYYTGTVFEMYDLAPENRRALFGGGRYDDLVGMFAPTRLSGVGFGMGDVTIRDFIDSHGLIPMLPASADVFVTMFDESGQESSRELARHMRQSGLRAISQIEPAKLGKQFKWAAQCRIPIVAIQGPDELVSQQVSLKNMVTGEQVTVLVSESVMTIRRWLGI